MDLYDPNRFLHRQPASSSSERFLGVSSHAPFLDHPSSSSSINGGDELSEDDVVFFTGDYPEPNHSSTPTSSSTSSTPRYHPHPSQNHNGCKSFGPPDSFGILAALPENEAPTNGRNDSHFFHKSSVSSASSSSSSSSRVIPAIPKPPQDRIPLHSLSSSVKYPHPHPYPQSAPVNVPVLSQHMMKTRRRPREFDEDDEFEEMLPPHEIVARNSAQTCSVLEGAGRTLKGRDLRKVRNAVWLQTGFID